MNNLSSQSQDHTNKTELGLYLHIPFCAKKCDYCDFLSAPATGDTMSRYFDALITEIEQYRGLTKDFIVPTIFIGGGTPSVVDSVYIEKVMEVVGNVFSVDRNQLEATIEINPGTVTEDKLLSYQKAGINRLSFGLQSADDTELALLGRIHTYGQFEANYKLARKLGFTNINIDLISAIPGQTLSSWEKTLNKVIELDPEHISAYSLIVEEGTKFYDRYSEGREGYQELPDEETDRDIYHRTSEILLKNGYERYEISNYAKKEFECRHNISYWIGKDYLGLGLGASSLLDGARFANLQTIEQYIDLCNIYKNRSINEIHFDGKKSNNNVRLKDFIGIRVNQKQLTLQERMEEFMFLGLRMTNGICLKSFNNRFKADIDHIYGDVIRCLMKDKLLESRGDCIRLTEYGTDISNYVFTQFLL